MYKNFSMSVAVGIALCFAVVSVWFVPSVLIRDILEHEATYGMSLDYCLTSPTLGVNNCSEYAHWVSSAGYNRWINACIIRYDNMNRKGRPTSAETCLEIYGVAYHDFVKFYSDVCNQNTSAIC